MHNISKGFLSVKLFMLIINVTLYFYVRAVHME